MRLPRQTARGRAANDFLNFEMTREAEVMDLQAGCSQEKYGLQSRRQGLQVSFDTATSAGLRRPADRLRDRPARRPRPPAPDAQTSRRPAAARAALSGTGSGVGVSVGGLARYLRESLPPLKAIGARKMPRSKMWLT